MSLQWYLNTFQARRLNNCHVPFRGYDFPCQCFLKGTLAMLVDTGRLSVKNLLFVFEMILYRITGFFINITACGYLQYGRPAKHRWQMLRREFGILGKVEVIDKYPLQLRLSN